MMNKLIADFPKHITEAIQIANDSMFRMPLLATHNVVICGMGGSGIGGEIVTSWVQESIQVPVACFHDYTVPAYIDKHTLLIASSYSGNTEETLIFMEQARKKGAWIVGICSGGAMKEYCQKYNLDYVLVPEGFQPRVALAFSMVQIANILTKLDFIDASFIDLIDRSKLLIEEKKHEICDKAQKLAEFIVGTVPILYATTPYNAVLTRARQQLNENSKMLCWTQVIPEMNHNELVGWSGGDARFSAVFFDTGDLSTNNQLRMTFSNTEIAKKTKTITFTIEGENFVERSIYFIHLVDWASWYLADLTRTDTMDIQVINRLKSALKSL